MRRMYCECPSVIQVGAAEKLAAEAAESEYAKQARAAAADMSKKAGATAEQLKQQAAQVRARVALWNPSHRLRVSSGQHRFNRGFDRGAPY